MNQLSLLELPETETSENAATLAAMATLSQPRAIVPNERFADPIARAVLLLNNRERASAPEDEAFSILIHAQDWLCLELPEWTHWVLREL